LRKVDVATNLLSNLFTRGEKSMTLGLVRLKGSPRYVKASFPFHN
jgi:hypothetical protein